ncbi:MAG: hypothetical protein K8U03_10060 [Planctomycetia bacterium]|nr:hypothetical protein [Planctomycetia bacterium]
MPTTNSPPETSSRLWWFLHLAVKIWLGLILLVILSAGFADYIVNQPPNIREHVSRDECPISLPASATDVSFYFPPALHPNKAYEFTVPEADFKQWASARGWPTQPIGPAGYNVRRYRAFIPGGEDEPIHIVDGHRYEWREEDRGVYCGFDRRSGRCYVYTHSR